MPYGHGDHRNGTLRRFCVSLVFVKTAGDEKMNFLLLDGQPTGNLVQTEKLLL